MRSTILLCLPLVLLYRQDGRSQVAEHFCRCPSKHCPYSDLSRSDLSLLEQLQRKILYKEPVKRCLCLIYTGYALLGLLQRVRCALGRTLAKLCPRFALELPWLSIGSCRSGIAAAALGSSRNSP